MPHLNEVYKYYLTTSRAAATGRFSFSIILYVQQAAPVLIVSRLMPALMSSELTFEEK